MYRVVSLCFVIWLMGACTSSGDKTSDSGSESIVVLQDTASPEDSKVILFFGNSLTAGYGLKLSEAYPALIQARLDSLGLPYKVINAGVSGETTATGNSRIDWVLESRVDIFVLELGGNDGLRGIPVSESYKNLQSIIEKVKQRSPATKIILAGMQVPPNMGREYAEEFAAIYPRLSKETQVELIPFLLENVGGVRELNLPDGIHPTPDGQRIVADNVWKVLKNVL